MSALHTWTAIALAALGLGGCLAWRQRNAPFPQSIALLLAPLLLLALLHCYVETALLATRWVWSACRLAPALGIFYGYPLYSPEGAGVINGWLYGPVAALAWTPAALATSPFPALLTAVIINLVGLLAPLAAATVGTAGRRTPIGWLAFAAAAAGLLQVYPTWYMASSLNADALAVGLGAFSCLVLATAPPGRTTPLLLAAGLGALAAWTKQIEAPLILAQIGWLVWQGRRRDAAVLTVAAVGWHAAVVGLLALAMDWPAVWFNLWTVPAAHARPGGWSAVVAEAGDFLRYTSVIWVVGTLALLARRRTLAPGQALAPAWGLWLAATVILLPAGILAALKVGGDRNSIHSVYYLMAGAAQALASLPAPTAARRTWLIPGLATLTTVALVAGTLHQVRGYPALPMLPTRCLSEEAWTYAREHPGKTYFPWDPLATLLAEGKFYPFEYGVIDRELAGFPPSAAQLTAALPTQLALVAYPRADYSRLMLRRCLPDYAPAGETADWLLFRRPAPPR